ncbi:MAG: DUF975 domain-containing protein [Cyanobacteria bacterium J06554_6]
MTSTTPIRPLNVGNVVSAAISLYRTNFKTYTGLSTKAILWYLVPVYGWARSLMILGQIGRLGFKELLREPEQPAEALRQVEPKLWSFLGVAMLVGLISFGVSIATSIVSTIALIPIMALSFLGSFGAALGAILQILVQLGMFGVQLWFQARFWLYDLFIAVETDQESVQSIGRSWQMTSGNAFRVQAVLVISYLIMLPLLILSAIPFLLVIPFAGGLFTENPDPTAALVFLLAFFLFFVLLLIVSIVAIPFWQALKSVLYYDLRSRREGLDLTLGDRGTV